VIHSVGLGRFELLTSCPRFRQAVTAYSLDSGRGLVGLLAV
jgi:hypothetical protein